MITGPWLLAIFIFSIFFLLVVIIKFRLNPFIALFVTSILTGFFVRMPVAEIADTIALGFGNTLKGIGIVIGLGIIFGRLLAESGATERIAHTLVRRVGEKNSPLAVTFTGYLASIPVFMDAAFVILISVVKKLSSLTKRPLITLVAALSVGLITTHNLVIPTPGPVAVANNLKINMGVFAVYALIVGIPAALVGGWLYGLLIGRNVSYKEAGDFKNNQSESTGKAPSSLMSFSILLMPILLILTGSILTFVLPENSPLSGIFSFIGDKNTALLISVLAGIVFLKKYISHPVSEVVAEAGEKSGMILLITGLGGSFAYVVRASGIGDYLVGTLSSVHVSLLVTGFILSAVLRASLGSSTVALITTSSILAPIVLQSSVSPILVALAICCGGSCLSLPNDSGFWVVTRFSNFKINETLKAWTLGASLSGIIGFITVLILSVIAGILPGLY